MTIQAEIGTEISCIRVITIMEQEGKEDLVKQLSTTLVDTVREELNDTELKTVIKALKFTIDSHKGQYIKLGEPYVCHPIRVALGILPAPGRAIAAALLHDTVEDTPVTLGDIQREFGKDVAIIVDALTKNPKPNPPYDHTEYEQTNHAKLLQFLDKDPYIIRIKLSDRLDNMNTVEAFHREKIKRYIHETATFYIPTGYEFGAADLAQKLESLIMQKERELLR